MDSSINSDLIRGHIDSIILHSLETGDKSTQQISDEVSANSNNKYELNQATLYSCLKRLEKLKIVNSYWQDSDGGRRKFFSITEKGKEAIKQKLSEWSYSRNVLDSLIGFQNQNNVQTNVIKASNTSVQENKEKTEKIPAESAKIDFSYSPNDFPNEFSQNNENKTINNTVENNDSKNDINYKFILNKLLNDNIIKNKPIEIEKNDLVNENNIDNQNIENKPEEITKIKDTLINSVDKDFVKDKIEYADIALKATKEGFKLKISTKDKLNKKKGLLINKINLISIIIASIIFSIEIIGLVNIFSLDKLNLSYLLSLIPFVVVLIMYLKNPTKIVKKQIGKESIILSLLFSFNASLIIIGINYIILGGDMLIKSNLFASVLFPIMLVINISVFFIVRFKISQIKKYNRF